MSVATRKPLRLLGLEAALPRRCHAYPLATSGDKGPIARTALRERALVFERQIPRAGCHSPALRPKGLRAGVAGGATRLPRAKRPPTQD